MKIDLGCGKNKRKDGEWIGVDSRPFEGVDVVHDLTTVFPWEDNSVEEFHCSHFVEHLNAHQRIHFVNEVYRTLKPEGKITIIVPHWASCRAYGDLTHQWPPVSEFWFYYLSSEWRKVNAPHNDLYSCNFEAVWGYMMRQDLAVRAVDFQQFAMANYKEAITDIQATLVKKEM